MRTLDETDFEILRLLTEDARRPYREIAEAVDLSSPSVSDRVTRLQELGIIRRFTLDLDRSKLRGGVPVLVGLSVQPAAAEGIHNTLAVTDGVEHVFMASDPRVFFQSRLPSANVRTFLTDTFDPEELKAITDYEVVVLTNADWTPQVEGTDLAVACVQCGNDVVMREKRFVSVAICTTCAVRRAKISFRHGTRTSVRTRRRSHYLALHSVLCLITTTISLERQSCSSLISRTLRCMMCRCVPTPNRRSPNPTNSAGITRTS